MVTSAERPYFYFRSKTDVTIVFPDPKTNNVVLFKRRQMAEVP